MTPIRDRLRTILLPTNPTGSSTWAPVEISGRSVFLRLLLRRGSTADDIRAAISRVVRADPGLPDDLSAARVWLHTDASHWGLEMVPVNITRTYSSVARLCCIAGVEPPPRFKAVVRPKPAALLEFQFATGPTPRDHAIITQFAQALSALADDLSTFECDHRYIVIDNQAPGEKTIALAGLTRVPADRSAREAHNHWINHHAALFANNHERIKDLAGYVQVHTTEDPESPYDNEFGGVAFLEYNSMADYVIGHLRWSTIAFNNAVVVDEKNVNLGSEFYLMRREELPLTRTSRP